MLKKIIAIKNVGRFRNSAAAGNPQLTKHTLILGPNGYGKTTLCAILRSLQTGDAAHVVGRRTLGVQEAPSVELLLDVATARFDGRAWSAVYTGIAIFDGTFVAENVHSGDAVDIEHRRGLYRIIVGSQGVALARLDTTLATESRAKTGEITAAARAIEVHMPAGMELDAFVALPETADIDALITAQEQTLAAIRQEATINARSALSEFPTSVFDDGLSELLSRTIEGIAQDAENLLAEHLEDHGMTGDGAGWIADGMAHAGDQTCPFCGQDIRGLPLIAAYRAVFSDRYNAFKDEIAGKRSDLARQFGDATLSRLGLTAERNRGAVEFWRQYISFDAAPLALPADVDAAARDLGNAALALLDRKAASPLDAAEPDPAFGDALERHNQAQAALAIANTAIRAVNERVTAKKAETAGADVASAEAELSRLRAIKRRHSEEVSALCTGHADLVAAKNAVDTERRSVRQQLDFHTREVVQPYERRINAYLDAFNAGFTIARTQHGFPGGIAASSYDLVINNTAVEIGDGRTPPNQPSFKNTLSAGDRTTLALAFFLAHAERDPALAQTVIVFDDPFNSQDSFRRRQTVHEIMRLAGRCAQVIVLSHDAAFLKHLWDRAPAAERTSLVIADQRALGSKIMPVDLEAACRGRTATDMDDLQAFLTTGAGRLLDIIRKMRVVLETYCRTTYPASFLPADTLGEIVRKIREGDSSHPANALYDELDQINEYTSQYHHGEDMADATSDQIDETELKGFTRRTLRLVNALQA